MAFSAEQFIGPLPHPDLLKKYQDIDPNLLDRVLTMAEEEGRARREGERLIVEAEVYSIECYPAEIALAYVPLRRWLPHLDDIAGATVATGGLGSVITVFIYGRSRKSQVDEIAFGKDDVK